MTEVYTVSTDPNEPPYVFENYEDARAFAVHRYPEEEVADILLIQVTLIDHELAKEMIEAEKEEAADVGAS